MAEIRDDRTILTCLQRQLQPKGVVGTRRDRDGLRLDSAASPFGARRGSGDAPFHSQTADIANPFQNISFLNASSSRWITNLSITSLSRPAFHVVAAMNTTRRLLLRLEPFGRISKRNLFETNCWKQLDW